MGQFPEFMRNPANRIASETQYTKGVEGYVYDGADGSQMAFWTNPNGSVSTEHTHPYDEYFVVVEGRYTVIMGENESLLRLAKSFSYLKVLRIVVNHCLVQERFMPLEAKGRDGRARMPGTTY